MKRATTYTAVIIGLAIGIAAGSAVAQTTANGPYYATPSWDQTLPAATRFIVLSNFASAAVLDRETGLVWEKSPSTSPFNFWGLASFRCNNLTTGGRSGWRLPTGQELMSLVDRSVPPPGPTLPSGHPFTNVQSSEYWSATTGTDISGAPDPTLAWVVEFDVGFMGSVFQKSNGLAFAWCVRGGQGVEAQ